MRLCNFGIILLLSSEPILLQLSNNAMKHFMSVKIDVFVSNRLYNFLTISYCIYTYPIGNMQSATLYLFDIALPKYVFTNANIRVFFLNLI